MSYPSSKWIPIAQLSKIGADDFLIVSTFYATYQDPVNFISVRWIHSPDNDQERTKTYSYDSGHGQMLKTYKNLISKEEPFTEIKPMMTKEEIWFEIKKCRDRVKKSDDWRRESTDK